MSQKKETTCKEFLEYLRSSTILTCRTERATCSCDFPYMTSISGFPPKMDFTCEGEIIVCKSKLQAGTLSIQINPKDFATRTKFE